MNWTLADLNAAVGTAARVVDPRGAFAARANELLPAVYAVGIMLATCRPRAA